MQNWTEHKPESVKSRVLAVGGWLLLLPTTALVAIAFLRSLAPQLFSSWHTPHFSRMSSALLFIALPVVVACLGCISIWRSWRNDEALRRDFFSGVSIIRQHAAIGLMIAATAVACGILAIVVGHIITD